MAVLVEQTIPFPPASLDIDNTPRWNALFPLIRPTIKAVHTPKGQTILIDEAQAKSKYLRVAAVGSARNVSSQLLDERNITAIVTDRAGAGLLTAQDIQHAIHSNGIAQNQGVVVVRAGKRQRVELHASDLLEVETNSELQQDHVLHLLGDATESCRTSIHHTADLLKGFVKTVTSTSSKFHTETVDGKPAVVHANETAGFQSAREAIQRDMKSVMSRVHKAQIAETKDVVYSVHYTDLNGLSRLESYIIAGEIAHYLDAENIRYSLSQSSIRDESDRSRGWAISISPISTHYLSPQPKPKLHSQPTDTQDAKATTKRNSALASSSIQFSDAEVRKRIEAGCNALIKEEATITEYDTLVGDGDCGYTLRDGAQQVLSFIKDKDLSRLPDIVAALVDELEVSIGGTSGALCCIYLTALASVLASESSVARALQVALDELFNYTPARVGDRTLMDVLIPFVETLVESDGATEKAVEKAKEGVESTKTMLATLGRSSYLSDSATQGVPDPGAYGFYVLLKGMSEA